MADIEVVIKISDEFYKRCKRECDEDESNGFIIDMVTLAIGNGTPLPKGHGRLIDADTLDIDNLNRAYDNNFELDFGRLYTTDVIDMIANAPTIIEADEESEE